jgi:hypothetical protein
MNSGLLSGRFVCIDGQELGGGTRYVHLDVTSEPSGLHPGAVATPLLMGGGLTEEAFVQRGKDRLAVPRIAAPEEISPAVVYFASDRSGYATGSELLVDGGWAIG